MKQKEESFKGDWFKLLEKDFKLLEIVMNENEIAATSKDTYKQKIKQLVNIAAFKYFLQLKETHTKLDELHYSEFKTQSYLKSQIINNKEKQFITVGNKFLA